MKCPHCNELLSMAERKGVEIDFCPKCRGVWLDRGELDKIIDLSVLEQLGEHRNSKSSSGGYKEASLSQSVSGYVDKFEQMLNKKKKYDSKHHYSHHKDYRYNKRRKKKSLLSELFDF